MNVRKPSLAPRRGAHRARYSAPRLSSFGRLRDVTMGATGLTPESGGAFFTLFDGEERPYRHIP